MTPNRPASRLARIDPSVARWLPDLGTALPIGLLLVVIALLVGLNSRLASPDFVETKLNSSLTLVLAAAGQTFVILTGGIDLSLGGSISLANSISATYMTDDPASVAVWLAIIVGIGLITGAVNGVLVAVARVAPFIATLATWSILSGAALLVRDQDGGRAAEPLKAVVRAEPLGIPGSLLLLIAVLLFWAWFKRSRWGVDLYAVGSSRAAAYLSGVGITRSIVLAYCLSSLFGALAGVYRTVQIGSGAPASGDPLILPSVAAVVIGGVSLAGGRGGLGMSVVGAFTLLLLTDVVFFAGIQSYFTSIIQGLLVLGAVILSAKVGRLGGRA